jgi:hypothetical protein
MTIEIEQTDCAAEDRSATPIGLARLAKMAFDGMDFGPLCEQLSERALGVPADPAALMDLSTIAQLTGRPDDRVTLQMQALTLQRVYRQPAAAADGLRLLAFMAPGDFLANTPVEFMLQGSGVTLDMLYVVPGWPLPPVPDHDVALVAATELADNKPVLDQIAALARTWPRPILNGPKRIARLTRDGAWTLLRSVPGVAFPMNARISREGLAAIANDGATTADVLDGATFPIIARPVDSHAGNGLAKLAGAADIAPYLGDQPAPAFFIAPFVDYRGPDGLYRKYRIALIAGRPYACHMAISNHWMIHYLNAGMMESAGKRAEEARFMAEFDRDFALRHRAALAVIAERIGLDYVTLDCAEAPDGRLLVFEAGNGMIVHAMDPPGLFPYKEPQMRKVFGAFEAMLRNARVPRRPAAAA